MMSLPMLPRFLTLLGLLLRAVVPLLSQTTPLPRLW
jgi:hypothetical protein